MCSALYYFLKVLLMWTIFKVIIESVTKLLLFYVLVFQSQGMWDPSSPTRDQTHTPCIGRRSPNHWTARKSCSAPSLVAQSVKNPPAMQAGDTGDAHSIPGWVRSPGEGNGSPLQYSCLRNPMDRGARWATVHGITKSQT